jgi:hypothetical protein
MGYNHYCCYCRFYIGGKCTLTKMSMDKFGSCTKFARK